MSNERGLISQGFRQRQSVSSLPEGYITNSSGMEFYFVILVVINFEENTWNVSTSMIKYVKLWKMCYLQLKAILENVWECMTANDFFLRRKKKRKKFTSNEYASHEAQFSLQKIFGAGTSI